MISKWLLGILDIRNWEWRLAIGNWLSQTSSISFPEKEICNQTIKTHQKIR
jgi:hypothetical protein